MYCTSCFINRLDLPTAGAQPKFLMDLQLLLCSTWQFLTPALMYPRGKELKRIWKKKKEQEQLLSWMTNVEKSEGGSIPIECLRWVSYNHLISAGRQECPLEGGREIRQHTEGGGSGTRPTPIPSFWVSDPVLSLSPSSRWKKLYFNTANVAGDALLLEC